MPAQSAGNAPPAHDEPPLRMRDLVRRSGLPRETIHFYIQQHLLPSAIKTGRNTALYTSEHLARLHRIRELQEKQFLPLKAIRAVLDESAPIKFTPDQEDLLRRVRATLSGWAEAQQDATVPVADLVPDRVPREELQELVRAGLVQVHGPATSGKVTEDDAVILECWAQFKEAGLGPERGVSPAEFHVWDQAMERLVKREARIAMRAYDGASVEEVSRVVEAAAPIIGLVTRSVLPLLRDIKPNLREAAAVLGASPLRAWREVDLPIVARALIVGAVFAFTISMGEFGATTLIARPESTTIPLAIYRLLGQPGLINYGQAMALSSILMTVSALAILLMERFRSGESEF